MDNISFLERIHNHKSIFKGFFGKLVMFEFVCKFDFTISGVPSALALSRFFKVLSYGSNFFSPPLPFVIEVET